MVVNRRWMKWWTQTESILGTNLIKDKFYFSFGSSAETMGEVGFSRGIKMICLDFWGAIISSIIIYGFHCLCKDKIPNIISVWYQSTLMHILQNNLRGLIKDSEDNDLVSVETHLMKNGTNIYIDRRGCYKNLCAGYFKWLSDITFQFCQMLQA